jgi:hypothetical protein
MRDASAQELLLLSALQECRIRLDEARRDEQGRESTKEQLRAALERGHALEAELARERERTQAVRIVLDALAASIGRFGLRRDAFQARVQEAGRNTPESGPQAARHAVLLEEVRRVLGRAGDAGRDPAG